MKVQEIMTKDVESVGPHHTIFEAAKIMKEKNIGALPIIDQDKASAMGFITDRDITIRCVAEQLDPVSTPVSQCMTRNLVTVHTDDEVETASQVMVDNKVRRVMVLDREEHPVGMLNLKHIGTHTHDPNLIDKTMNDFFSPNQHHA